MKVISKALSAAFQRLDQRALPIHRSWLTDPDAGPDRRYTENRIDWMSVATVRRPTRPRGPGRPGDAAACRPVVPELGRRSSPTWGVWQANPAARVPILSPAMISATEGEIDLTDRERHRMRYSLAKLDATSAANRCFLRNLAWAMQGNNFGLDYYRGGPADDQDFNTPDR